MKQVIEVTHRADVVRARQTAIEIAEAIGFDLTTRGEIAIAVSELVSNLVRHGGGGTCILTPLDDGGVIGLEIEAVDRGPGIPDIEAAMADGYSTAGSLGYGLGTVNRIMDELEIESPGVGGGTRVVARRWRQQRSPPLRPCPLSFGIATRAHPTADVNGDAFVLKQWGANALVAVIDGVGHGHFAHQAALAARGYVENHCARPVAEIFRGVARACRATRGVVMALARIDWEHQTLAVAGIGNVEVRVYGSTVPVHPILRRGILGVNAPEPIVTEAAWAPEALMVIHSDGIRSRWRWEDFPGLDQQPAETIAQTLLRALASETDDATVLVVRGQTP